MKKLTYILFIVMVILLVDTAQALILNYPPIIGIGTRGMKKEGILVDTYYCDEHDYHTVFKGVKFSCHVMDYTLVDKTKEIDEIGCDNALQNFYEDDQYVYYWNCIKDEYMIVRYASGKEITISEALNTNIIDIQELDEAGIEYIKNEKQKVELQSPPDLYLYYIESGTQKAKALIGTYSWKMTKCGYEQIICADSLHPSEMKYQDENTLKYQDSIISIESENALISSVNIYDINKTDKIKKISYDNKSIMLGNLQKGEYVLEIIATYTQGNVYYGVKVIVE